jgi:hypothetical protein
MEKLFGAYPDLQNDFYHNADCPGINSSKLKIINDSYLKFNCKIEDEDEEKTKALIFGTALHTCLFEENLFLEKYKILKKFGLTKIEKEEKQKFLDENKNSILLKEEDYLKVLEMKKVILKNSEVFNMLKNGSPELAHFWTDKDHDILCKFKSDYIRPDKGIIFDLKTTEDASEYNFSRSILKYGYHFSGAFYIDGAREIYNKDFIFAIIAIEKKYPYELGLYVLGDDTIDKGRKSYKEALKKYKLFLETENKNILFEKNFKIINLPNWALKENLNEF